MKVGETIVFNTKIAAFTFLFSTMFDWIKEMINESDEVWRWLHWKYGMSQIVQNLHSIKKNILPCCCEWFLMEIIKQLIRVIKYGDGCI